MDINLTRKKFILCGKCGRGDEAEMQIVGKRHKRQIRIRKIKMTKRQRGKYIKRGRNNNPGTVG